MTQRRVGTAALLAVLVAALVLTVPSLRDVVARIGDMAPGWVWGRSPLPSWPRAFGAAVAGSAT